MRPTAAPANKSCLPVSVEHGTGQCEATFTRPACRSAARASLLHQRRLSRRVRGFQAMSQGRHTPGLLASEQRRLSTPRVHRPAQRGLVLCSALRPSGIAVPPEAPNPPRGNRLEGHGRTLPRACLPRDQRQLVRLHGQVAKTRRFLAFVGRIP
jgi:hypothetical protein